MNYITDINFFFELNDQLLERFQILTTQVLLIL
jgi:hypothetical protein